MRILIVIFFFLSVSNAYSQNPTTAQVDSLKKIGYEITAIPQSGGSTLYKAKDLFLNDPAKKAMIDQQRLLLKDSKTFYGFYTNNAGKSGLEILHVVSGSDAAIAGIKKGDIIKYVNGKLIRSSSLLIKSLLDNKPGDLIAIGLTRNGEQLEKEIKLSQSPFISRAIANEALRKQRIAEMEKLSIENAKREKEKRDSEKERQDAIAKEQSEKAELEAKKLEKERLAKIEKDKLAAEEEKEKQAQIEKEQLAAEEERLAKLKKEQQANVEAERLAKVEKEQEAKIKEEERLAKVEKDRLAKLERERLVAAEAQKKKLENEERKRLKEKERNAKKEAKARIEKTKADKPKEPKPKKQVNDQASADNFYNIDEQDLKKINDIKSTLKNKWDNEKKASENPEYIEMTQEVASMILRDHGIQANAARNNEGAVITGVSENSYAAKIFNIGDIIFSVDDNLVKNHIDLALVLEHIFNGDKVNLLVLRNNSVKKLKYKPLDQP